MELAYFSAKYRWLNIVLSYLILPNCSPGQGNCSGSEVASRSFVKDLGLNSIETLSKDGIHPRLLPGALVGFRNYANPEDPSEATDGNCSAILSFENEQDAQDVRLWTGDHCIGIGRTKEVSLKVYSNGGYVDFPVTIPFLEFEKNFRNQSAGQDQKLVQRITAAAQNEAKRQGVESCISDFARLGPESASRFQHVCFSLADLSTFPIKLGNLKQNQQTILSELHAIFFEDMKRDSSWLKEQQEISEKYDSLMITRIQGNILESMGDLLENEQDKDSYSDEDPDANLFSDPDVKSRYLKLAEQFYRPILQSTNLATLSKSGLSLNNFENVFDNLEQARSREAELESQETSLSSTIFKTAFADLSGGKNPLVLFVSNKYQGESYYHATKLPLGFDSNGQPIAALQKIASEVRIDAKENIIVVMLKKDNKIFEAELGDSGAMLGAAPNTLGFVGMSSVDGVPTTTLSGVPTQAGKNPEKTSAVIPSTMDKDVIPPYTEPNENPFPNPGQVTFPGSTSPNTRPGEQKTSTDGPMPPSSAETGPSSVPQKVSDSNTFSRDPESVRESAAANAKPANTCL